MAVNDGKEGGQEERIERECAMAVGLSQTLTRGQFLGPIYN